VRALLVVAAALVLAAPASAQKRALIGLDGSKSLNEDAGNGGTRLDAAKAAVHELLDKLPPGAPLGLRVYGARDTGCNDTQLSFPVGPLEKGKLGAAVDALKGAGRTPIGASLLATPDDLGSAPGRRSVILVSDGGDNCAPPDPCKAAQQVAQRGVDLAISVVGLQVSARVRRQLRCIADVGGGSYVDVHDAGQLGNELAALLARAYRSYEPAGTKVSGAPSAGAGPLLGPGLFQDSFKPGEQRWYALQAPKGKRVLASVTAIPAYAASGGAGWRVELDDPGGEEVGSDQALLNGGLNATERGRVDTQSVRTDDVVAGGRYRLGVTLQAGNLDPQPVPLEIGVQFLAPGEEVGLVRAPGAIATPTPTPTVASSGGPSGWLVVVGAAVVGLLVGLGVTRELR
jgi:Ca-activated chloride channel family protein